MAVNFSKKLWNALCIATWSKGEHSHCLFGENGCGEVCLCLLSEVVVFGVWKSHLWRTGEEKQRSHIPWNFSWLGSRSQTCSSSVTCLRGQKEQRQRNNNQPILPKFIDALLIPSPWATWPAYHLCPDFARSKDTKPVAFSVFQPMLSGWERLNPCFHTSLLFSSLLSD